MGDEIRFEFSRLNENTNSLSGWLRSINAEDIDTDGLAADFDGSLSGLGTEVGAAAFNMSDALHALPVFKQEMLKGDQYEHGFQYVLCASTSPATKQGEETLTYLNQGQSYELKLTKIASFSELEGKMVKSVIRVVFHERRHQFVEQEQLEFWKQMRPGERVVNLDIPLSYGLTKATTDGQHLNSVQFTWDPSKDVGAFIKVHCISTEFTAKKHGGEKGVPFRIQVETYEADDNGLNDQLVHAASCQIKVFKPKGADRKNKTDREKVEKRPATEQSKYQPSYECTVLQEVPLPQVKVYLQQLSQVNSGNLQQQQQQQQQRRQQQQQRQACSNTQTVDLDSSKRSVTSDSSRLYRDESSESSDDIPPAVVTLPLTWSTVQLQPDASAHQVKEWLLQHRFGAYSKAFQNFSGEDILKLTREDLIQICGLADGIRLNNSLQARAVRPKLTLFVSQLDDASSKQDTIRPRVSSSSSGSRISTCRTPTPPPSLLSTSPCSSSTTQCSASILQSSTPLTQASAPAGSAPATHGSSPIIHGASPVTHGSAPAPAKHTPAAGHATTVSRPAASSPPLHPPSLLQLLKMPLNSSTPCPITTSLNSSTPCSVITSRPTRTSSSSLNSSPATQSFKRFRDQQDDDDPSDADCPSTASKKAKTRRLTLRSSGVFHAVYLDQLTVADLKDKLAAVLNVGSGQLGEVRLQQDGIKILVTDEVVQNLEDVRRYHIEGEPEEDSALYTILLTLLSKDTSITPFT